MPIKQLNLQCAKCDAIVPHNQPTPNHVVHALVSLFLIGLWIPIWIIIAMTANKAEATCVKCGSRRLPTGAATTATVAAPAAVVAIDPATERRNNKVAVVMIVGGLMLVGALVAYTMYLEG